MKRTVSTILIFAMMLASLLAIIPASAAKTLDTPSATYNVNWKYLYENGTMRSQWCYDQSSQQNNYEQLFNVTATENQISSAAKRRGDTRAYYSNAMFDITADTYYEYVFEAKNNPSDPTGDAGVIFAYATDPSAFSDGVDDWNADVEGDKTSPYWLYGAFQNKSNAGEDCFELDVHFGHHDPEYKLNSGNAATGTGKDIDGFVKYKVVYDGLKVRFYYLNASDEFVQIFSDFDLTLPTGAKVAFGVYSQGRTQNTVVRSCVLSAYNDAAALTLAKGALSAAVLAGDNQSAKTGYTPLTSAALASALTEAKAVLNNAESTVDNYNSARTALDEKIAGLKKSADKTSLAAKITEANNAIEGHAAADYIDATWQPFYNALTVATSVNADTEASQTEVDSATDNLTYALLALTLNGQINKNFLEITLNSCASLVESDYTPSSWAVYRVAYDAANAEFTSAESTQDSVDKANGDLKAAIEALVECADFSKLKKAVAEAELLDKDDYYENSWGIDAPLATAKAALSNYELTQDEIDVACAALNNAVKQLISKRHNVLYMGESPTPSNYNGEGNVFYFDYHKYIAAKGYTAGVKFPTSLDAAGDQGNADYVLRLGTINGSGTVTACDGNKTSATFSHQAKAVTVGGKEYNHVFGYSFYKAATVDSIAFYLPTDTNIASIDVYGAIRVEKDGKTLYGKASSGETDAPKTYLGSFSVPAASAGDENVVIKGDLTEALRVEYIFFAIKFKDGTSGNYYKIYEIELFGVLDEAKAPSEYKAADFSALKAQYDIYNSIVEKDYTADSWARVAAAIKLTDPVNKNCLSSAADIAAAAKTLGDALEALVVNATVKTELETAISNAKKLKESEYTPNTWKAVKSALDSADQVIASAKSPQTAIDNAAKALNSAMEALIKRGDKTALKEAIEAAKKYTKENYSGNLTSWKMFENALKKAEAIYADDNSDQDTVDNIKADLVLKQADLVTVPGFVPEKETEETEAQTEDTDGATESKEETDAPEKKGGCGSSVALSALAVAMLIGSAIAFRKKD